MSILLEKNEAKASRDIENLASKRKETAARLEAFRNALSVLGGGVPVSLQDIWEILEAHKPGDMIERQTRIVEFYLISHGNAGARYFHRDQLLNSVRPTHELTTAFEACGNVTSRINTKEDLFYYWSPDLDKFEAPYVTEADKEEIRKRAEIRVATEDEATLYKRIKEELTIINISQQTSGRRVIGREIRESYPWMVPFVKESTPGEYPAKPYLRNWILDESKMNFVNHPFRAAGE
jgi:hypothetical protein